MSFLFTSFSFIFASVSHKINYSWRCRSVKFFTMNLSLLEVKILGSLLLILIGMVGYFFKRILDKQDKKNEEQSEINKRLTESFDNLNTTMATISEGFKWMKESCAERHVVLNKRISKLENKEE